MNYTNSILSFCDFRKQGLHPSGSLAADFRYTRRTGCGSVCTWSDVPFTDRRARATLHQLRHDIRGMCWTAQTQMHAWIQINKRWGCCREICIDLVWCRLWVANSVLIYKPHARSLSHIYRWIFHMCPSTYALFIHNFNPFMTVNFWLRYGRHIRY